MATIPQYVNAMRDVVVEVGRKRGCDPSQADKPTRVLALALLTVLAVVLKTLEDKGVLTPADLQATLDAARGASYPSEPVEPPAPGGQS